MRPLRAPRFAFASILILASLASAGPLHAAAPALYQINPVAEAPSSINTPSSSIWDAYPWFSKDGKLFFFTRETQGTDLAHTYVSYIKNRGQVINAAVGQTLPSLTVATPQKLAGAWNNGSSAAQTIKAIAYCESDPVDKVSSTLHIYDFVLFYSTGAQANRELYRVGLEVRVNPATPAIISSQVTATENPMGTNVNVPGSNKNSTEPMLTRDGRYFFWASNSFTDKRAHFIDSAVACSQDNDPVWKYELLPAGRFAWQDQFVDDPNLDDWHETSRTNYHTVLERTNGDTALIFERCTARIDVPCSEENGTSRYCDCAIDDDPNVPKEKKYGVLMTTGFDAGNEPHEIKQCFTTLSGGTWNLNDGPQAQTNLRDTHPAISGPPTLGGHWLLFFMRQKKIWYTKIAECPGGNCTCPIQ